MNSLKRKYSREYDLDFVRIVSILAVVCIHGIAGAVLTKEIDSSGWLIANTIDSFSRWAVPVFIMLSGALLIKPLNKLEVKNFLKKRFSHILIPIILWPAIYTLWYAYMANTSPDWRGLLFGYLAGSNVAPHIYFLFIIAGLYAIAPIINIIRGATTNKQFFILSIITLTATTLWFTIASFLLSQSISFNVLTQFIPYIGYFMLGSSIKDFRFKNIRTPFYLFFTSGITMTIATYVTASSYGVDGNGLFFYSYFSILTMIMAPLALLSLKNIFHLLDSKLTEDTKEKAHSLIFKISNATFGVYLIHMIILSFLPRAISIDPISIKGSLILITLTILISYALSLLLIRTPYLKHLF